MTDNINVGTAHVTIYGKGKFNGTVENTFKIEPVPAKSLSFFADNTEFEYDGKPHEMHIAVKFGEITLQEGIDYNVEYADNIKPGNASAKLIFQGNFTGAMNIPFTITNHFINTSKLSTDVVNYTEELTVTALAEGGVAPYRYAYYVKHDDIKNWKTISDFSEESSITYKPMFITDYIINVKIKDAEDNIAEKQLPFTVQSTLDANCRLSADTIALSEPVTIITEMEEDVSDFVFKYFIRKITENKWTLLERKKGLSQFEFTPEQKGNYSICISIRNGKDKNTKQYLKLTVE